MRNYGNKHTSFLQRDTKTISRNIYIYWTILLKAKRLVSVDTFIDVMISEDEQDSYIRLKALIKTLN